MHVVNTLELFNIWIAAVIFYRYEALKDPAPPSIGSPRSALKDTVGTRIDFRWHLLLD